MRSIFKHGLIYIWIISILINACPVVAFAFFLEKEGQKSKLELKTELNDTEKEVSVVGEILEKRTINEKHYLLEDGSIKAVIYPEAVHYEEDGKLVDIDNTLVSTSSGFKTKRSNIVSEFSKEESLLTINYKEHEISWKMKNIEKANGTIEKDFLTSSGLYSIPSLESKIEYSEVLKDIDLEYELVSDRIEENIIIGNKESIKDTFVYSLTTKDLVVKQLTKNELVFLDKEGKEVFYVSAPVMYDSNLEFSSDITLTPKKVEEGYEITLQADSNWLNSKERIFPITIDPIIATSPNRDDIVDTYIYPNDASNTGKGNAHILRVGSTSYSDINTNKNPFRSLIKFKLPTLTSGDQVIAAELHIFNYQNTNDWTPPSGNIQIDIHAVTKDWNESNAYWNNMKDSYNSQIVDYIKYSYDSNNQNKENTADITSLVKDWYVSGNNYGLLLKEHVEKKVSGRNDVSFISSDTSSAYTYKRPYIIIQYRNQTGLENYLTTHTQSIGRTTTMTNDYNGNLTLIHRDASTPGSRLPVSINHVYNTNDKETNIGYGNGFRLNLNQTIEAKTISGINYLLYIDEDATRHYFYQESGTWKDEDGLDLTITTSGTNYIMKDKGGNVSTFIKNNGKWYLKEIKDTNDNKITINYGSNYNLITSVEDAVGDTLTLTYTNNLLTSITDVDNRVYKYGYNSNNLTSITYPDSLKTEYQYTNKLLSKVINVDGSSVSYTYHSKSPYRVKSVTEYGNKGTVGNSITMKYGSNTTSFKDNKGNLENYTFNNLGQTLSINSLDKNNSLKNAYGVSYQYGTSGSTKNKLLLETQMVKSTNNEILNSSAEKNLNYWNVSNWGVNNGNVSVIKDGYIGSNSFKIESIVENSNPILWQSVPMNAGGTYTLSAYIKGNIDAYYFYEYKDSSGTYHHEFLGPIKINANYDRYSKTFTIPTDSVSNTKVGIAIFDVGSILVDNIQLEEGNVTNPYNLVDNGNFSNGASDWERQANLGSNDKVVTIRGINAFQMYGEMEKWKHLYKIIPISGKKGDSFNVSFWAKNNGSPIGNSKADKLVFQYLDGSGNILYSEVISVLSDTSEWQYLSDNFVAKQDYESLKVILAYNYNTSYSYFSNIGVYKDEKGSSYTYDENGNVISTSDLANQNSRYYYSKKNELIGALNPKGRMFYYEYDYNHTNRLLQAFNQNGLTSSYEYDDYGNVTSNKITEPSMIRSTDDIEENTYYYIKPVATNLVVGDKDSNVELIDGKKTWKFIKTGEDYFIVDENEKALTVKDSNTANSISILLSNKSNSNSQKYKLSNNNDGTFYFQTKITDYKSCIDIHGAIYEKGRNIQQYQCNLTDAQKFMIYPVDGQNKYIETKAEYTENGNYQNKVIDQRGYEVTTTYNENRGTVSEVVDAKRIATEYTYDINDNITQIKSGNTTNSYTYDKDYLTKITHNNFDYDFVRDEYGNTTSIKVAGSPLITHQYEANNGYLLKSIYGNNDTINYEYDTFGRISKKTNTTGTATYAYNNRGYLSHLNYLNNDIYYTYDLSGRITSIKENNFKKQYQYDQYNNLDKVKYNYNSKEKEVSYTYDADDKLVTITYPDYSVHYTYDKLDRLIKKEIIRDDKTYTTTYEYYDVDEYKTTTLLKRITNGTTKLEYTYDANGNILTIKKNGNYQKRYSYDSLNQLKREYSGKFYSYIGYSYDSGGNLIQKYQNNYTMDALAFSPMLKVPPTDFIVDAQTPSSTNILGEYQYDNNWKDQLTQFNEKPITYDSIGNMTSYNGYNYTWTNGNELKTISQDNNQYEYEYNVEGIRTKKVINGKTTNYYLEGNNIIYEDRNGEIIEYLYDESGVSGLIVNNQTYYFVKNIQGDIIEILDCEFNAVANYTYNTWGVVTVNNLTEDNIGDINPYRYRGYYYDTETNLYYLNSRYYNPTLGRFISADSILGANGDILEYNLYAYCSNNPIMFSDPSGEFAIPLELVPLIPLTIPFVVEGVKALGRGISTIASGVREADIAIKSSVSRDRKQRKDEGPKAYYVYLLTDSNDKVQYVGRTKDLAETKRRHRRNPYRKHLEMRALNIYGPMTLNAARGLEETKIIEYRTLNEFNKANNQIHGISLKNPKRDIYLDAANNWWDLEHETYVGG